MKRPFFIRQVLKTTLYYAIGFFITWLVYKLSGTPYPHGLNLYHLVGLLVLAGGFVWALRAVLSLFTAKRQVGVLLVHILVIGGFIATFLFEIYHDPGTNYETLPEAIVTVTSDSANKFSSAINGTGDTLFLKKSDTTFMDKIEKDSNKIDYR